MLFNVQRREKFRRLAGKVLLLREVDILCQLLGQGAAACGQRTGPQVCLQRPDDGHRVHAVVQLKPAVLHGDDGVDVGLGDGIAGGESGVGREGLV